MEARVGVDDRHRAPARLRTPQHLAEQRGRGVAGTDHHDAQSVGLVGAAEREQSRLETNQRHEEEAETGAEHDDRDRHMAREQHFAAQKDRQIDGAGTKEAASLIRARVAPHVAIETEDRVSGDRDEQADRQKGQEPSPMVRRDAAVEAQDEGERAGAGEHERIEHHQQGVAAEPHHGARDRRPQMTSSPAPLTHPHRSAHPS